METTKRPRFTSNRMLEVLTEIQILCRRRKFLPTNYCKKQPSVWHFTRVLIEKGVLIKIKGQYKWIGVDANEQMAKDVIYKVNEYNRKNKERFRARNEIIEKVSTETIQFPPSEVLPELELYKPIKEDLVDIQEDYLSALKDLKEDLDEANAKISIFRVQNKELFTNNSLLLDTKQDLKKQLAEYELDISELLKENGELKYQIDKMQEVRQEKKSKQRKVKFLGITIFKID